jgi:hypothetical protein
VRAVVVGKKLKVTVGRAVALRLTEKTQVPPALMDVLTDVIALAKR